MFYGAITKARNALYEKGWLKSFSLGIPTISIGNITVGGTGKTPVVAFVAEILAEHGEKVCILTRGYGRENAKQRVLVSDGETILAEAKKAGDEPFELARKLLGKSIVVADANRVSAGSDASRSPCSRWTRSSTRWSMILARATSSAASLMSIAVTWQLAALFARQTAMIPLPVPTSAILQADSLAPPRLIKSKTSITRNSVSGRGINTCEFT